MIIDRDSKPKDTVYYTAACILEIGYSNEYNVEVLYDILRNKHNESLEYNIYLLSLNFLFLIDKISISKKGVLQCF